MPNDIFSRLKQMQNGGSILVTSDMFQADKQKTFDKIQKLRGRNFEDLMNVTKLQDLNTLYGDTKSSKTGE